MVARYPWIASRGLPTCIQETRSAVMRLLVKRKLLSLMWWQHLQLTLTHLGGGGGKECSAFSAKLYDKFDFKAYSFCPKTRVSSNTWWHHFQVMSLCQGQHFSFLPEAVWESLLGMGLSNLPKWLAPGLWNLYLIQFCRRHGLPYCLEYQSDIIQKERKYRLL